MAAKKKGRPEFVPTDEMRQKVEALRGRAATKAECAHILGIDVKTLCKHFPNELRFGESRAVLKASDKLIQLVEAGDFQAIKFLLTRRGGKRWRDRQRPWEEKAPAQNGPTAELAKQMDEELVRKFESLLDKEDSEPQVD